MLGWAWPFTGSLAPTSRSGRSGKGAKDHLQLKARVNRPLSDKKSAQDPPSQTLGKRIDLLEVHRHFDSLSFLL